MPSGSPPTFARRALLLSDVHLSESSPRTAELFFRFIDQAKQAGIDALFILGDLFEYWAGDDDLMDPLNRRVVRMLRDLGTHNIALFLVTGNRDLLLGAGFAHSTAAEMLNDPAEIEVEGHKYLVSHGDALCTDDHAYQAYRRSVRSKSWQKSFLARPLTERKELIASMREASEAAKSSKAEAIMDVNPGAVAELFRQTGATVLVHGHTHRPGRCDVEVDGIARQRWVLPDWDGEVDPPRGGALLADAQGLQWMPLNP
ncbi:MAG: UDP-2,3-diacylglucosamine diphosphatase [Burkholderiaceae bacterium]|jgi:UDP-2,3-diacylglucosamine hydrolase